MLTLATLIGRVACDNPATAVQLAAANGTLTATVQEGHYPRNAPPTEDARDATIVVNAQLMGATTGAATLEIMQQKSPICHSC